MKKWAFFITFFSVFLLLAACSDGTTGNTKTYGTKVATVKQASKPSLQLLDKANIGKYLADSKGMALYYYTKDFPGISNCSGQCLVNWPALSVKNFEVPKGFNKSDFGTLKREDNGVEQVTYKGYPLYYYIQDKAKGDVTGQGVGNVWFIVNPQTAFQADSTDNFDYDD